MGRLRYEVGTRILGWRDTPDAVDQHRSPLHLNGRGGLAHLLRCAGAASGPSAPWTHRRPRSDEVRRLAAAERGVRQAVRYRNAQLAVSGGSKEEVPLNWNKWVRQTHRWLSIAFTVAVIVNIVAVGKGKYTVWVVLLALLPLALLLFPGLYLFGLPNATKWGSGRRAD